MTEEEILEAIVVNNYGHDALMPGANKWEVSPEKLAAFLAKHLPTPTDT